MKNCASNFQSKPDQIQSSCKSLSNRAINYFSHEGLFKKLSQNTHEKQYFTFLSPKKTKQNLPNEKANFSKRPSLNYLKKSIYPTSMQNVCPNDDLLVQSKQFNPQRTLDCATKEKINADQTKKAFYTHNSLNLTSVPTLRPKFPTRNSINYSNLKNLSYGSTEKKFEQTPTLRQKDKISFRKNNNEKQNFVKMTHTRYASSYAMFSKPSLKVNPKIDSTPRLFNNPKPMKTSIKELFISDFENESRLQKLSFVDNKADSQVNICVSSGQDIGDVEVTARFNFAQEKHQFQLKGLSGTATSLQNSLNETYRRRITLSQFILGPCKGKGRYGRVYLAVDKQTGWICALKQFSITAVKQMLPQFINELKTQTFLDHPYITKIYGYFVDKESVYLIMEYVNDGSLYDLIKRNGPVQQKKAAIQLHQVSQGLSHMHSFHIIHRDLKPENIIIAFGVCKICDFGWAIKCSNKRQTSCGTLDYLSPEMVQGTSYSNSIDLWAMGVLMYEMLVGKPPFYNISVKETRKRIKECQFTMPETLSKQSKSLIECFLRKNPGQRREMDGILRHAFFQKVQE